jgi:hypothetical protein
MVVRLRVAGLVLAARAPRPCRALALPAPLRRFAADRGEGIRLEVTEAPAPEPGPLLFESGGLWRVHRHGTRLLYLFHEPRPGAPLERALQIDRGLRRGVLHIPGENWRQRAGFALGYPLDELLFQHRFALEDALELHACGLVAGGRGVLLCGSSGAGKTTAARLWGRLRRGTLVLSDDRIVVRALGRGFRVHGTPWHGSGRYALDASCPLAAVFFIRHAPASEAVRLDRAAAAGQLFARAFPPPWDRRGIAAALATCDRLASRVACFDLGFRPDASAVAAVESALTTLRPGD